MFSSMKQVYVAAVVAAMALSPVAQACLHFGGMTSVGFSVGGSITSTDNGVQTCSGDITGGDNNVDCIDGFSLNYDYSDNPQAGPLPVTYCNPGECYSIAIPLDCDTSNACCGGEIPCTCTACTFNYDTFC